jgi:hypothetical protein
MGQAAYSTIGELEGKHTENLYLQLSEQFLNLQQILQAMRGEYVELIQSDYGILSSIKLTLQ